MANQDTKVSAYVKLVQTGDLLHGRVSKPLIARGLTASQFTTLKSLYFRGALAQRDVARCLLKTCGNVTVVVDNLEKQGLVTRTRDTRDRRLVYVQLTPAGRAMFEEHYDSHLDRIREAMEGLSDAECKALMGLLDRLAAEEFESACA